MHNQARTRTHTHSQCCTHTTLYTRLHEMYAASAACILTRAHVHACVMHARNSHARSLHTRDTQSHTHKKKKHLHTQALRSTAQHERVQCKPVASALVHSSSTPATGKPVASTGGELHILFGDISADITDIKKKNRLKKTNFKTCSSKPVATAATRQFEQWGLVPR